MSNKCPECSKPFRFKEEKDAKICAVCVQERIVARARKLRKMAHELTEDSANRIAADLVAEEMRGVGWRINEACRDLPENYYITIYLEKNSGTVALDKEGTNIPVDSSEGLAEGLRNATEMAVEDDEREVQIQSGNVPEVGKTPYE